MSSLGVRLVYLAAQEMGGRSLLGGDRTLHLKGPHLDLGWAGVGVGRPLVQHPCPHVALPREPSPPRPALRHLWATPTSRPG